MPLGIKAIGAAAIIGAAMLVGPFAFAQAAQRQMACVENGVVIFESTSNDIAKFNARARGLTLIKTRKIEGRDAVMFIYEPGPVICAAYTNDAK